MINNALGNYPLTKCSYSSLTAMVRYEPATIIFAKLKVVSFPAAKKKHVDRGLEMRIFGMVFDANY